jgi:hypothetical protein
LGLASAPAQAATPTDQLQINVTGNPISSLTVNPLALSPPFAPDTQDYVVRCQAGVNNLARSRSAPSRARSSASR